MSLITFDAKCAGARSAGNPHAACDVAGAGNGATDDPSRARRGKPWTQTRGLLVGDRASSRPYQVFVRIHGKQHYLYRAVDEDGDVIDILVQTRRDTKAAVGLFRKLIQRQGGGPRRVVTAKLESYPAVHRWVTPGVIHVTDRYANNRAGVSHQSTWQ